MTDVQPSVPATPEQPASESSLSPSPQSSSSRSSWQSTLSSAEVDTRLFGMVIAVIVIWIAFNILSGGDFLTARNMWNLSVQSTSIAIMATGMVLIIVSRNIDLSVGSLLGFLGYVMALVQTDGVIAFFNINISLGSVGDSSWIWVIALVVGIAMGAAVGGVQGFIIAYGGVPAFIVTLGGFLVWRGMIFRTGGKQGQTLAPLNDTFQLFGGGPDGSLGEWKSWLFAVLGCALIVFGLVLSRRRRQRYDLTVRPLWMDVTFGVVGCLVVLAGVGLVANKYISPISGDPTGIAYPGRHADHRDGADELPGPPAPLRPLRVRIRRQPRSR